MLIYCSLPTQILNRALNESKRRCLFTSCSYLNIRYQTVKTNKNDDYECFFEKMGNSKFNVASVGRFSLGENKIYCDSPSLSSKIEKFPRAEAEIHISFTSMLRNVVCAICPFPKLRRVSQCKLKMTFTEKRRQNLRFKKVPQAYIRTT